MKMAYLISWQLVFTILSLHLRDSHSQNAEHKKIVKGTYRFNLQCFKGTNIIWRKNGQKIPFQKNWNSHILPLLCVSKELEGLYTCHAQENDGVGQNSTRLRLLKSINVTVLESNPVESCGNILKKDIRQVSCGSLFLEKDYFCCKIRQNPANKVDVALKPIWLQDDSYSKCDIYEPNSIKQPWTVFVNWTLRSIGLYGGTMGWQIKLHGSAGAANFGYCIQIKRKWDELLNCTFPADILTMGARYKITLQTFPEITSDFDSNPNSNSIVKYVRIPSLQDMCQEIGSECNWEICLEVEDLTVTNYSFFPIVSWRRSPLYKTRHFFEVIYSDESISDSFIAENESYTFTNLNFNYSSKHYVEVRPIFITENDIKIKGIKSKKLMFYVAEPDSIIPQKGGEHSLKIIIAVCAAATALIVIIFMFVYTWASHKRKEYQPNPDPSNTFPPQLVPPIDVLLVHDGHCGLCNDVTHKLAHVLCATGYINCHLDLCSNNEIQVSGPYKWYEDNVRKCKKIVIICTKEAKNTYYTDNVPSDTTSRNQVIFRSAMSMILGERGNGGNVLNENRNENVSSRKVIIPVYFDYSSWQDIPCFLKDRQSYSLPSEMEELLMCLSDISAELIFHPGSNLQNKINECEKAIQNVKKSRSHGHGHKIGFMVNYESKSSSSSSTVGNFR